MSPSMLIPMDFYPHPPHGGRPGPMWITCTACSFLSTPSARRATISFPKIVTSNLISTHALRVEGDPLSLVSVSIESNFYPRPRVEGDFAAILNNDPEIKFLPTPSRRGRQVQAELDSLKAIFLPTPSRRGRLRRHVVVATISAFLPTPSRRGRPSCFQCWTRDPVNFYPRPRVGVV